MVDLRLHTRLVGWILRSRVRCPDFGYVGCYAHTFVVRLRLRYLPRTVVYLRLRAHDGCYTTHLFTGWIGICVHTMPRLLLLPVVYVDRLHLPVTRWLRYARCYAFTPRLHCWLLICYVTAIYVVYLHTLVVVPLRLLRWIPYGFRLHTLPVTRLGLDTTCGCYPVAILVVCYRIYAFDYVYHFGYAFGLPFPLRSHTRSRIHLPGCCCRLVTRVVFTVVAVGPRLRFAVAVTLRLPTLRLLDVAVLRLPVTLRCGRLRLHLPVLPHTGCVWLRLHARLLRTVVARLVTHGY